MGDPRRIRKKYKRPKKLWDKLRVTEEKRLKNEYGLKNMQSLWVARAELRKIRREARKILGMEEKEKDAVLKKINKKLTRLNILPDNASVDDILSLNIRSILERRLQTIVYRKGLAKTINQARQLITHGFIAINGKRIKNPGYLVSASEENNIGYYKDPSNIFKEVKNEQDEEQKNEEEAEQKEKLETKAEEV